MLSKTGLLHSAAAVDGSGGTAKCETKIENQAEPLEAMAHRVKTQIKQLVGQAEEPNWAHLGTERDVPEPSSIHIEVEGWGFSRL